MTGVKLNFWNSLPESTILGDVKAQHEVIRLSKLSDQFGLKALLLISKSPICRVHFIAAFSLRKISAISSSGTLPFSGWHEGLKTHYCMAD